MTYRRIQFASLLLLAVFLVVPTVVHGAKTIVRAVYKGGLDLQEEPAGTVLADSSVCLPKNHGAERYDYKGQLAKTVEKANTRMTALILDQKIAGYGSSIELLDRNIALLSSTAEALKQLDGITGYLLPIGALKTTPYSGAKFEGKCYKTPDAAQFGHPDALGELNPVFEKAYLYVESSAELDNALQKELPEKLKEFVALENNRTLSKEQKEERFGKLAEEVMTKVKDFMAIDPTVAAKLMPREFDWRGTKISSTPTISLAGTGQDCIYVYTLKVFGQPVKDINIKGKFYDITVNAISVLHTFRKCMPEKQALEMLKDKVEEKKTLLQKSRAKFVKLLSDAGKELVNLQQKKPQHFGD